MTVYQYAYHVIALGEVRFCDNDDDYMGTQTAAQFFESNLFPLWERTPWDDQRDATHGKVETYRLDLAQ